MFSHFSSLMSRAFTPCPPLCAPCCQQTPVVALIVQCDCLLGSGWPLHSWNRQKGAVTQSFFLAESVLQLLLFNLHCVWNKSDCNSFDSTWVWAFEYVFYCDIFLMCPPLVFISIKTCARVFMHECFLIRARCWLWLHRPFPSEALPQMTNSHSRCHHPLLHKINGLPSLFSAFIDEWSCSVLILGAYSKCCGYPLIVT